MSKGPWIRGVVTNLVEQIGALYDITNFLFFFAFFSFSTKQRKEISRGRTGWRNISVVAHVLTLLWRLIVIRATTHCVTIG